MASMYSDLDRPPLDVAALRRAVLKSGSLWTSVEVLQAVPSTNALIKERAADGASGLVLIAEHQTAGRGRLDRSWVTPARSGVTMSMLLRPYDVVAERWSWIGLMAGLAVAASITAVTRIDAGLKWPNDVMLDDRKTAGLLVERIEIPGQRPAAVVGIGLNVSLRADELPVPTATSLALAGAETLDRSLLVRTILRTFEGLFNDWQSRGGDPSYGLDRAYAAACTSLGQHVRVSEPDGTTTEGLAAAIYDSGRLVVTAESGQRVFAAGDIVHVRSVL